MLEVAVQKRLNGFQLATAFAAAAERVVLFGPSGSGKSLTVQTIAGTVQPDSGRIVIDGQPVYDSARHINLPPQARRVGYVPQHYALFPHLTTAENIGFGLRDRPRRERERRVAEMIDLLGLHGLERRRPHELSGGQQQRVALARALAVQPRLLLLDEPFAALDAPLRGALREELLHVQMRSGVSLLIVTHDLADAFTLGQHVVVYEHGRIIQQGTRDEIFFHPATRRVAELVGMRNILPATVERAEAGTLWLRWAGRHLAAEPAPFAPGTPVYLCIRPAQVLIVRPERLTLRQRENLLCGRIVSETMQAETYTLDLRLDNSDQPYDLVIELPSYVYHRLALDTEKRIMVELRRQALHIIPREV